MIHTPGPWKTAPCAGGGLLLVRPNSGQISLQIFPAADATLIASAPDLLAALHRTIDGEPCQREATGQDADCDEYAEYDTWNWCWVCAARAAIARAEGA